MIFRILFLLFFVSFSSSAQDKVKWSNQYNASNRSVEMTATIAEGWHLYSQHISNEIGPIPTAFQFIENEAISLVGKVKEPQSIKEYDENFEATLDFFKEKATFSQEVKALGATNVEVIITFMVCNDVMCLPPVDEKYVIEILP